MKIKLKSKRYFFEKLKAGLLVSLIILCIVQVGILWSSESGSFPISLFSVFETKSQFSFDKSEEDYLLPYRVVISTGFDGDHYVIPNGSQEYNTLWEGAKQYLRQALPNKPNQTQPFNEDVWGTLVANKPYFYEFKTQIPIDIVKWVLSITENSAGQGIPSIYKIVICPGDPNNNYSDTLYIRDDKNIYTYSLAVSKDNSLNKDAFKKLLDDKQQSEKKQSDETVKNYRISIENYRKKSGESLIEMTQDLIGPFAHASSEEYPHITCTPITGSNSQTHSISEYDNIAYEIFGKVKNNYDPDVDVNGSTVFKRTDSVYKLHQNSILEYKFTGNSINNQKPTVLSAYKSAISFIMEHSSQSTFMSGISIYLTSINEDRESYTFNFDYSISLGDQDGEVPILIKNYKLPKADKQIDNCISVKVSSKGVVHCNWLALKFKVSKSKTAYRWSFEDMQSKTFDTYSELQGQKPSTKDFGIYYVLSYPESSKNQITPSFVLYSRDGIYDILMEEEAK
jgi:hypothetical protein